MAIPGLFKIGSNALAGHMKKMAPVMSAFGASLDPYAAAEPVQKMPTFGGDYDPYAAVATTKLNQFVTGAEAPPDLTFTAPGTTPGIGSGQMASLGGDWSNIDQLNDYISRAAAATGVDPNQIKAIMKLESGGIWQTSPAGAIGYMQVMPSWGEDFGMNLNDPYQNILAGAKVLKINLDESGGDFREALRRYHGYGWDGFTTDQGYADVVLGNYQQLNSRGGTAGTGIAGGGTANSNALGSMFGTGNVPDWGEFGVESSNGFYGYGRDYGMNGTQHTGVDVPMNVGTAYRAPMGGTVTCAGTGRGSGADGGGCAAFGDDFGNGAGRVEVLLDNGAVLIFGHSSTSALQPGARFNAGQVLGTSGGSVSPHVHLEARVRDASMPSGWRIVDPRTVMGGGGIGVGGGGMGSFETPFQRMQRVLGGS